MFSIITVITLVLIGIVFRNKLNINYFLIYYIGFLILFFSYFSLKYIIYLNYDFISEIFILNQVVLIGIILFLTLCIVNIYNYNSKIKNKYLYYLLFITIFFFINVIFLLFIGELDITYFNRQLSSSYPETIILKEYSGDHFGIELIGFFLVVINTIYFFIYYIYTIILDKTIKFKKKIYYFLRDIFIMFIIFISIIFTYDIKELYNSYYQWYKNPVHFSHDSYICIDNTKLILEREYRHHPIVNNFDSFFQFYKNYGTKINEGDKILSNRLNKELVTKEYLSTCVTKYNINYYQSYLNIHGETPKIKMDNYGSDDTDYMYNRLYSHTKKEVAEILKQLKNNK